jgi:hypothetical protein
MKLEDYINEVLMGIRLINTDVPWAGTVLCRGLTGKEKILKRIQYDKAYCEAIDIGIPTEEELLIKLKENGRWTDAHQLNLDKIDANIKMLKSQLPGLKWKKAREKRLKEKINKQSEIRSNRAAKKAALMSGCAERWADQQALFGCIYMLFKKLDGTPLWRDEQHFLETDKEEAESLIFSYMNNFFIDVTKVREIARSGIWRVYFKGAPTIDSLFGKPPADLDENQINVLFWSSVYDNAFKSLDPPDDDVLADDELFDIWSDEQYQEYKTSVRKRKIDKDVSNKSRNSGANQKKEMFIMTDDRGAKEFYNDIRR